MNPEFQWTLARMTIAQAKLVLARQRVYECECDFSKGVTRARATATCAADQLEAILLKVEDPTS